MTTPFTFVLSFAVDVRNRPNHRAHGSTSLPDLWHARSAFPLFAGRAVYDHAFQQLHADGLEMQNSGLSLRSLTRNSIAAVLCTTGSSGITRTS